MARIQGADKDKAPDEVRAVFEEQEKRYGFVTGTARVYGLRPTIQRGVRALSEGIQASGLIERELLHLVCVKTASINGCPF
ncbi:MAG: hypothetical protein QF619_08980 [Candidatus Binatia bacterium]|nr:hypothetical protein [Candidatus Binatia bacterium]